MVNATTPCEPVPRHVGVPSFKGHGDTPSSAGPPAHVVHGEHQGMSTVHS